jgi:hypothetical protein
MKQNTLPSIGSSPLLVCVRTQSVLFYVRTVHSALRVLQEPMRPPSRQLVRIQYNLRRTHLGFAVNLAARFSLGNNVGPMKGRGRA